MERAEMRAGDGDREAVATRLKAALDDGRLDLHEYDERLQRTYAAKTFGELDPLIADLPGTIPADRAQVQPMPPAAAPVPAASGRAAPNWVVPYAGVIAVSVLIWAISSFASGDLLYFWPVWMLIPLILGIAGQMGGRSNRDRRRGR
jgi:Domain of unknown function (DUF1707)